MRAAILAIGDELTLGQNVDTNSPWIAAKLAERSIQTIEQRIVADDRAAIAKAVSELVAFVDVLMITGGLGPTADDLTREALNDALSPDEAMVQDDAALEQIVALFHRRGRVMPEMNRKQALRPGRMRCISNPNGTAPGLIGTSGSCLIVAMPGPPREMHPMFTNHVIPELPRGPQVMLAGTVSEFGLGESDAAQRLGTLMDRTRNPLVGITVSDTVVSARVRVKGDATTAQQQLNETLDQVAACWRPYAFGRDGMTLAEAIGAELKRARRSLVTAESCTGGWLGKAIVDVAGSSDYYRGGWVTYTDEMKQQQLKVDPMTLCEFGAVSPQVAKAMAEGALKIGGADEAISITGIAGPARDDRPSAKPTGTVYIGLARRTDHGSRTLVRHFVFPGDRTTIRDRACKAAMQMLRFALLNEPDNLPLLWEHFTEQKSLDHADEHCTG